MLARIHCQEIELSACEMRKADCMSQMLRISRLWLLVCSPIVLTGCQHPLAPSIAGPQPAEVNYAVVETGAAAPVEMATPAGASAIADVQAEPDSLTLQLGEGLLQVLKTFTGR